MKSEEILKENDLYVITDQRDNLLEIIEDILIAGVKIIQHRFKTGTDQDHLQEAIQIKNLCKSCLLYTSPSPRDDISSRMPSSA